MADQLSLDVYLSDARVGRLDLEDQQRLRFAYSRPWRESGVPIAPCLPLEAAEETSEIWQSAARAFFENLLPEGRALDDTCRALQISKSSIFGLLRALGSEASGAIRILPPDAGQGQPRYRIVPREELSARIRDRQDLPFSVWDGTVRLSIAGYQDKLAVHESGDEWALVEGDDLASTHIVKPDPMAPRLAGLTSNEFVCMRLAAAAGLSVAPVRLRHVPEPILVVERFDREYTDDRVKRVHVIDGCQAMGAAASLKYERPFGDNRDLAHMRTGVSLPLLFALGRRWAATPAAFKLQLLRWAIFQALIQNFEVHAKNISFFWSRRGLQVAPAYDLISIGIYPPDWFSRTFAMAFGDAFTPDELSPYEWANMAYHCDIRPRQLATELKKMANRILTVADEVARQTIDEGAERSMVDRTLELVTNCCESQAALAAEVPRVDTSLFEDNRPSDS